MFKEHSVVSAGSPCETMGAPILEATLSRVREPGLQMRAVSLAVASSQTYSF